jgi:SH2 domain-containing protein 4A
MLKLILANGYVDPELLEQLNEEQKEMIFLKLREEQIRKWKIREEKLQQEKAGQPQTRPKGSKVRH